MRGRALAMMAAVSLVAASDTFGERAPPQVAYVSREAAGVRAGPGDDFYVTDHLELGTAVEVYRYDGPDWVAIKPPAGSFSWVPSNAVNVDWQTGLAEVIREGVKTRIGARDSDTRDVEYISLRKGELVELVDFAELSSMALANLPDWYKIMPASGEFRWVNREAISFTQPGTAAEQETVHSAASGTHPDPMARGDEPRAEGELELAQWSGVVGPPEARSMAQQQQADRPTETTSSGISAPVWSIVPPAEAFQAEETETDSTASPTELGGGGMPRSPTPAPSMVQGRHALQRLDQELGEVHVLLTQEVCQAPEDWRLNPLRGRVQAVIDTSDNAQLRERAQYLLARIAQFEDLQRRHKKLATAPALALDATTLPLTADIPSSTLATQPDTFGLSTHSSYDGSGWLMPLVTSRPGLPRYALTDAHGQIQQFVTPVPGLNLRRYEQQRIGVYGQRGYLPTLNQPHLLAERIVLLDRVR
jgi:hypothetical protein